MRSFRLCLSPCFQFGLIYIRGETFAGKDFCAASHDALHPLCGIAHAAAAGCGKGNDGFPAEIVGVQERINDGRFPIPPDREADIDYFHLGNRGIFIRKGWTGVQNPAFRYTRSRLSAQDAEAAGRFG